MVRTALFLGVASLSLFGRDPGCGGVGSTSSGVNAPCERTSDCADGLTCEQGVCVGPSVGDAGGEAGGGGVGDAGDNG